MTRPALALLALLTAGTAAAETVVPTRNIRAREVIAPGDLRVVDGDTAGAAAETAQVVGREARTTLYAGRPVRLSEIGAPALVDRNDVVPLVYRAGGLNIATDGRALGRAGAGDWLRVMNLASRTTVQGRLATDGRVYVGPAAHAQGARP